jgi:hypothetical protein
MFYNQRGFVVFVEVLYLLFLFALALVYLTDLHTVLRLNIPATLGSLPIGVPWFGALGAVTISLAGAFDHRTDWDPSWSFWHFTRPLVGISLAIVSWLIFVAGILAVGSNPAAQGTDKNLLYYVIAFVVGYREEIFRDLIKRVADVILTPSGGGPPPVISGISPTGGPAGARVAILGSGLTGTTSVRFGTTPASSFTVDSDGKVTATAPPGAAGTAVKITVTTKAGSATGGEFTYE